MHPSRFSSLSSLVSSPPLVFQIQMRQIVDAAATSKNASNASAALAQRSPWHSPVPYLFGGLAAMLGLIAFALLILACSYWRFTGFLDSSRRRERESDPENAHRQEGSLKQQIPAAQPQMMEMKVVVIMAGDQKPTYLATPISKIDAPPFLKDADDGNREHKDIAHKNGGDHETQDEGSGDHGAQRSDG
ncbi:hypothetical protein ACLOJK_030608 [Asimina triloba]